VRALIWFTGNLEGGTTRVGVEWIGYWVLGIGCECCGLRKTAAGCVIPFSPFFCDTGG